MSQPEMLIIVTHNWVLKSVTDYKKNMYDKELKQEWVPELYYRSVSINVL